MSKLEPKDSGGMVTHTLDNQSSLAKTLRQKEIQPVEEEGLSLETETKPDYI